jgi:hypothetical protein
VRRLIQLEDFMLVVALAMAVSIAVRVGWEIGGTIWSIFP